MTTKFPRTMTGRASVELLLRRSIPAQPWQLATPPPMLRVAGMSPYRPTRRDFLIGAGSLLVLAPYGCGGESGEGGKATSGGTRTVEHALGTTEVPENPQRVVALGISPAEVALALGIEPVATDGATASYPYLDLGSVETVGELGAPNLEAIATTNPDLILGLDVNVEETYEELSEIASTVGIRFGESSSEWKRHGRAFANTLRGESGAQRYDEMLSAYEQDAQEIGRQVRQARGEDFSVAIMRSSTEYQRFDLPNLFSGSVLYRDVGLPLPEGLREPAEEGEYSLEVSNEQLSLGDADAIFVYGGVGVDAKEQSAEQIETLREEPLFQRLRAAESDNVYPVGAHWFSGNITAVSLILDDLEQYLFKGESTGGETS